MAGTKMYVLLITYNLNDDDDDYEKLFKAIRALGDTWHNASKLDSVWFVYTSVTAEAARDRLWKVMDDNDSLFVLDASKGGAYWRGMAQSFTDWIQDRRPKARASG